MVVEPEQSVYELTGALQDRGLGVALVNGFRLSGGEVVLLCCHRSPRWDLNSENRDGPTKSPQRNRSGIRFESGKRAAFSGHCLRR